MRYDGDDPYLVVAADKGTAAFSDVANEIALRPRLLARRRVRVGRSRTATTTRRWASPPAARGSRCAATSATSASIPTATTSPSSASATCRATCSATAMLLSQHIQLVAAFDHRHVFLDPDPDAASVVRGAQAAVRAAALVVGRLRHRAHLGGRRRVPAHAEVDRRSPPEVRARLGIDADVDALHAGRADPRDPARARRPALQRRHRHLREGAHARRNADVGDKANDAVRVDGAELRCRARRRGRQPRASPRTAASSTRSHGGLINTDAIDNSAGVDTSDHEVNIKILLDGAVRDGELARRRPQRAARSA